MSRPSYTLQTLTSSLDLTEVPLSEADASDQNIEDEPVVERGSSSPPLPLFAGDQAAVGQHSPSPPFQPLSLQVDDQESLAMEEMRENFKWLIDMLGENQERAWGTGYRDFADVSLLLRAVAQLGMTERGNGRISDGEFHASSGSYALNLSTFINAVGLGHSSATWRNKMTMYFRLKSLHSYTQHTSGKYFQSKEHQNVWEIVSHWVKNEDMLLPVSWITKKYGNTQLRTLVREMLQEASQSKCR